jgi:hypothetical protein
MDNPPTPRKKGRGLETLLRHAEEHNSRFGLTVIEAMQKRGINELFLVRELGTGPQTFRAMLNRESVNISYHVTIERLSVLSTLLVIEMSRLHALYFYNSDAHEDAFVEYLHTLYHRLTEEKRRFGLAMMEALLNEPDIEQTHNKKDAILYDEDDIQ